MVGTIPGQGGGDVPKWEHHVLTAQYALMKSEVVKGKQEGSWHVAVVCVLSPPPGGCERFPYYALF